jgi:hypothetical protein
MSAGYYANRRTAWRTNSPKFGDQAKLLEQDE